MNHSPKLSLHVGTIDATFVENNLSEYLLKLIDGGISHFNIKYMESETKLKEYYAYYADVENNSSFPDQLHYSTICGYNKGNMPLTISSVSGENGIVRLIDNQLIYFPKGISLVNRNNNYLFDWSTDKLYTSVKPLDIIKEFMDLGYKLFLNEGKDFSEAKLYNLLNPNEPAILKQISLNSIDSNIFG